MDKVLDCYREIQKRITWLQDGIAGSYTGAFQDYLESEHSPETKEYLLDLDAIMAITTKHINQLSEGS